MVTVMLKMGEVREMERTWVLDDMSHQINLRAILPLNILLGEIIYCISNFDLNILFQMKAS